MNSKDEALAAIDRARGEMEEALCQLEQIPMFDSGQIAYAAHATQSYLTVIDATTELLRAKFQDSSDTEVHRMLDGLHHVTQLMFHTVCQLMNTASHAPSMKLTEVELPRLAARACSYYRQIAARKQIAITFHAAEETPHVWVDPVALAAALDNLLSNAIKYSPPGTIVKVEVKPQGDWVVCSIQDQGPGISEDDQALLFRKGVRLSATPTGGEPSLGYGLAVAADLVAKIGGKIHCQSKLGSGACFTIRLPIVAKAIGETNHSDRFSIPLKMEG